MMDRICLLTLILFSFVRAGGVQAAPYPKSLAGAGNSQGNTHVNPGHSASASIRSDKPPAAASTQHAPSHSTSDLPRPTLSRTGKSTAGAHNSANPDQHLVSTSSASGVGSSTSRIASASASRPSDHSTSAPPRSTLSGAHNFANPDQHLVSTSSTSGVGSSTSSRTASASASRSSSFESRSGSAAARSSSVARSISASHSRSNTASSSLASSSSAKFHPSAISSLSASSDSFGPISSFGQSQSYSSSTTATRSNSSKTFMSLTRSASSPTGTTRSFSSSSRSASIAIQPPATVPIPAIHPAVVATPVGVQPKDSSSAAPTLTTMRPAETLTTVGPPLRHVMQPLAPYIGAPLTESIAIPAAAIPTVVQPKDSPTIPAALIPGVMRPAEAMMTFAPMNPPPHVMQSPGAVTATWDPMPTVWEAGGNGYPYVDSSSMMHDGDTETEYYGPAVAYMTESMSDLGAASMMDGPLTATVYGIRIGASVAATLSSSTMVFTTVAYSAFTSNSHTFTTSFPITSTAITLIPAPTVTGVAPLSGSSKSPRNTALIVGLAVPFSALLIAGITGLVLWRRRRQLVQQQILESEATFFPARLVSQPSSIRSLSVYSDVNADELDLAGPPLQASSTRLSSFLTPGVSLRDALALRPTTPVQGEYLASRQASIVDPSPQSPASSSGSSAARQEQLANEVIMVREEIGTLEKRASA
ncbi:hypothetical protein B0H16DRAFT_667846 [Mycena metata]|uniref:Uncharacterized protein n=1 Tax=Mycena metata TaxID=1033252 RepID=A0AAD7J5T2_9AGAR|nr:hypothetical protein B0H16DRAFT_667846 [Mycena metata]